MQLYMPTNVYSENDCVRNHAAQLQAVGRKAMIVTGKTSAIKCGALADVLAALGDVPYVIFDKIEENPSIETVMVARDVALMEKVDFFIGIGGGSPMDAAKAIALMTASPDCGEEILYTAVQKPHLPVVCIPTTCGTGSEVTPYAILTRHEKQTKKSIAHRISPVLALMDVKYLKFMPRHILVNTCVDALCHLLESWLNANSNQLNRVYAREGLQLWGQFKDRLLNDTVTDEDYTTMLHASTLAGMAITHTSTSLPHAMSYAVTYHLGVPHGKACGYFIGGFVDTYGDPNEALAAVSVLGFDSTKAFRTYMNQLVGIADLNEDLLAPAAETILADAGKMKNHPFPMDLAKMLALLN